MTPPPPPQTRILLGEARESLRRLPAESVHCCVTSPPYWGMRNYGDEPGMIGREPTFEAHMSNLLSVFREVRRVMRPDATLWFNYGDCYARPGRSIPGAKHKDLLLLPYRLAIALHATDGVSAVRSSGTSRTRLPSLRLIGRLQPTNTCSFSPRRASTSTTHTQCVSRPPRDTATSAR